MAERVTAKEVTRLIKQTLSKALPEAEEIQMWEDFLKHATDIHIRWEAFKLAMAYLHGKPVQPVSSGPVQVDPITLNVNHIGATGEFFKKQAAILGLK